MSDVDVGLAPTKSEESTESERIHSRNKFLSETFAVETPSYSDLKGQRQPPIWNPAEQVWVDAHNRLDVTGFFWDEAQVTNLRVALLQQANQLCLLKRRISDMKQEEDKHSRRVEELFCQAMGENSNVLEVSSPSPLFAARKLLARLNELENRLLESEVDAQHFEVGVGALNEEIIDWIDARIFEN